MAFVNYQARLEPGSPFYTGDAEGLAEENHPNSQTAYMDTPAEGAYRSYAQRQLEVRRQQTHSVAEDRENAKLAAAYDKAEVRQVDTQVAEEYRQADERIQQLHDETDPMREAVKEMLRQIDGRRTTAATAMAFIKHVRQDIARLTAQRDELDRAILVSGTKVKFPHQYLDAMFNTYTYLPRPSVFGEPTARRSNRFPSEERVHFRAS